MFPHHHTHEPESRLAALLLYSVVVFTAAYLLPGVSVDSYLTALVVAVVLAVINTFIKPLLVLLTLPLTILSLGIFYLVLNVLLLQAASSLVSGFHLDGFWPAFWFGTVLWISNRALHVRI
ncbi:MAG TPA: phage holin family protein [bacterium]|nr:phage holin family protein [bacterium]